ncbi:unnamed protein product [Clonostachys rhizophaga]|uniref:Polyketide synthase n=1 Tax=Clonostachys rhizophaga TaxID=160324 RepID=A0A9N9VTJ7_9HYPO|nr:unnamed protein product [Clonostachys rhizophaga]
MAQDTPIAIVGLAYRAPGIGRKGLWDYLSEARSAWTKIPGDRFQHDAYFRPGADKAGCLKSEGGHLLSEDIYNFDAAFFNMRAEEAKNADPQHRMLLECALEASENAGYSLLDLAGKNIGSYVALGAMEYANRLFGDVFAATTFSATGIAPCMFANRLSYFFDIHGPSIGAEAACASSAYAIHQACQGVRNGDCDAAFVGGSTLFMAPNSWISLEKTGALSDHGRCYSYDHKASGFGRGEGGACLLIKRLDDAISAGDPIHAMIRSSACNHGGRSEGITMPRRMAHEILLRRVHDAVGLSPDETPVVEGHGTGTAAGDPIEAGAFAAVLGKNRTEENPLYIGSVKSNFGHLEGASGIVGIVKAIYMLKNKVILPTAGFEKINHRIPGKEKIVVAQLPIPWPESEKRRVLVTNFGFGGSNAAVLLEAAPEHVTNGTNGTQLNGNGVATPENPLRRLFVFSAKTKQSLTDYLTSFESYLAEVPESGEFIKNLSYTLGQRRSHHAHRAAVIADSVEDLQDKVASAKPIRARDKTIAFVFTGQGAQHAQMASGLRHYKVFSEALDKAEDHLKSMGATWSLNEELSKPAAESRINSAEISQPACTAVQLALVALLTSWSVKPSRVTGHSSGEIGAAYSAGLVNFKTAIALAFFRGQAAAKLISQQTQKGAMLALGVGFDDASALIEKHADGAYATVGAINSPQSVTVSGDESAINKIQQAAEKDGIFNRKLKIELAYHSRHMQAVADSYLDAITPFYLDNTTLVGKEDQLPQFFSSVVGHLVEPEFVDASYWVKNLVQPVKFSDALQSLLTSSESKIGTGQVQPNLLVEIGPHSALKGPINQTVDLVRQVSNQGKKMVFNYLPSLVRGSGAEDTLLALASDLFTLGAKIYLGGVNQTDINNAEVLTELPAYCWDHSTHYELRPRMVNEILFPGDPYHPILGRRANTSGSNERTYRQVFTLDELPWIRDHGVAGTVIFPMTGYLSCIIEAARRNAVTKPGAFVIRDFHAVRSLEVQEEQSVDIATKLKPVSTGPGTFSTTAWTFDISTWTEAGGWTIHCYGRIEVETAEMTSESPTMKDSLALVDTPGLIEHDIAWAYATAGVRGTNYGPTFRNTVKFFEGKGFTVIEQQLRDGIEPNSYGSPAAVDPPTLDGFLQGGGSLQEVEGKRRAQMPNYFSRLRVSNSMPSEDKQKYTIVTRMLNNDNKGGRMQISVAAFAKGADGSLTPVAEWESLSFRAISSAEDDDEFTEIPENWCWELVPRFDFLSPEELMKSLTVGDIGNTALIRGQKLGHVASYYIDQALKVTANDDFSGLPPHLARFVKWAAKAIARESYDLSVKPTALLEEVMNEDAQGELLCKIGENLVPILRGEIQPLEIMLKDGLLTRHYEADSSNEHFSKVIGDLVLNVSDLEPNLRILEIGAGTAGTTLHVMNALSRNNEEGAFLSWTFTDISAGFFENARDKLSKWGNKIIYKKLDISQDPVKQGFKLQDYDIVIASNVLHATADMRETMTNVRSLLRPKGMVVLLEANRHPPPTLPFALLPGWWYAIDEYRDQEEGPLLTVENWNRVLIDVGFSGVDTAIQDYPGSPNQMISVLSSTRIGKRDDTPQITICGPFIDEEEVEFAQSVADSISDQFDASVSLKPFAEVDSVDDPFYIFIDSPKHTLLEDVTEETFDLLKTMLLRNKGLMWVVPEGGAPESRIIRGLLHTLRLEDQTKHMLLFEDVPLVAQSLPGIVKLAKIMQDPEIFEGEDQDFTWHKNSIHLPRMKQLREVKEKFAVEQGVSVKTVQKMWQPDSSLELTIEAAGSPDSLYYHRTNVLNEPLGDNEVLVEAEAAGLSYRDLNIIFGYIPWAPPGYDGAGKIIKTGSKVSSLQPGDSVFYLSLEKSAFATHNKLPAAHVAKVPVGLSKTDAAGLPMAYSIAILALLRIGRLRKDETVLIHAAAGAVGQACVVLAKHLGARIFATAGTESKREFLHETFGIPKEQIFSKELKEVFADLVTLLNRNIIKPIGPVTLVPASDLPSGLRKLRSGDHMGKIVVTLGKDESVLAESALQPTPVPLKSDATYLITGGTRGIGLSLAYWLIENGAKNIIALGRSGGSGPEVQKLLEKYDGTDVTVRAYACDVGSKSDLIQVVESIKDLPPVKGVVHGALILSDKLLENATYEDWKIVTGPRIQGAWNLNDLLPDLDFFIGLSSFLGDTGNIGQSIYGGTAAFYESFARYRNARGQNTVSIALPVVLDVGYVASNELTDRLKATLGATLRMSDIFAMVKSAIQGQATSPIYTNGKATAFKMALNGQSIEDLPWTYFHPVHIKARLAAGADDQNAAGGTGVDHTASWTSASDPLVGLTEALITKVSAMTMIERSEIEPDAPLASHGLDSLVSVELRNWIRRETSVELALTTITQSASLHALASHVLLQIPKA